MANSRDHLSLTPGPIWTAVVLMLASALGNFPSPAGVELVVRELWYMVLVEKRRRDLTLVDPFWHNRDVAYADLVWPADLDLPTTDRLYGTGDFSGITAAKIAATKGPVYINDQDDVNFNALREAGYRTVHAQGALYELIAQGHEPSTHGR